MTLRAVGFVCTFVGFGFLSLGDALTQVGAMCRDAPRGPQGSPVEDITMLDNGEQRGAPVWYYDVKLGVASSSLIGITKGRK